MRSAAPRGTRRERAAASRRSMRCRPRTPPPGRPRLRARATESSAAAGRACSKRRWRHQPAVRVRPARAATLAGAHMLRDVRALAVGNMYPPHHLGGYELVWRSAVRHLRELGHEVRVLTTDFRLPSPREAADPDVHRELRWWWREHAFPQRPLRERLAIERHNARVLERHLDELRPDVVSWWSMGGMSMSLIERVRR